MPRALPSAALTSLGVWPFLCENEVERSFLGLLRKTNGYLDGACHKWDNRWHIRYRSS